MKNMKIIDSVEVHYFRSLYQAKLKDVGAYNVIVGSNDSGKSNILRALSLFFDGKISSSEDFSFLEDVTHSRQDEAREAKGRLTIWMRVTFNNHEAWKTLPDKFSVKKVWNRYSEYPEVTYEAENQTSVTKYLNKIKFHYVPAVKTSDTYSRYLRELYESLSNKQDLDLIAPAKVLSETVNGAVATMSDRIREATKVESNINIPSNFIDIFERLSFSTK
jgi:AAA15 family ATPase/GTPase